jgi:RNA polymerase sigma factor (sigma-70 family)
VNESTWLVERFEENRPHLRSVAYRMLGSAVEAEDAVQGAWLRLNRTHSGSVDNLGGWLTTVVARVCLDMLRSRKARRENSMEALSAEPMAPAGAGNPEHDAIQAESVGLALLVVLEMLTPAERVAFVLHDMFDLPFEEIASILGRSAEATRQLASRARQRVRTGAPVPPAELTRQREVVDAFLAASRDGNFEALLALLHPDVITHADPVAAKAGAPSGVRGASEVAKRFAGRAQAAQAATIDGVPGAVWAPGGRTRTVFAFTIENGKILAIDLIMDPKQIAAMDVVLLDR